MAHYPTGIISPDRPAATPDSPLLRPVAEADIQRELRSTRRPFFDGVMKLVFGRSIVEGVNRDYATAAVLGRTMRAEAAAKSGTVRVQDAFKIEPAGVPGVIGRGDADSYTVGSGSGADAWKEDGLLHDVKSDGAPSVLTARDSDRTQAKN